MTTFNWIIPQMDRLTTDGFVVTVHYNVTATDDTYSASTYGTVSYTQEPGEQYTPYDQLTEAQVVGWVKGSMGDEGVKALEDALAANIAEQKAPKKASGTPWSK